MASTETISLPELKEKLVVSPASSNYPTLGNAYKSPAYTVNYSNRLIRTGKHCYDTEKEIQKDIRISLASEDLAIQLGLERAGIDPRKAEVFNDIFGRNDTNWYAFQWTKTGLRVPKGYKADKHETDSQGRKYWPRIVLIEDHEIGEILVPEGNGRVVPKPSNPNNYEEVWDEVFGMPRITSDKDGDMKLENHTTHFYFDTNPDKDKTSGNYDIAVARGGGWHPVGPVRCLDVYAGFGRWAAGSYDGFRPVEGSIPEIERELAKTNPKDVENDLLGKMRKDAKMMTLDKFIEKYKLI